MAIRQYNPIAKYSKNSPGQSISPWKWLRTMQFRLYSIIGYLSMPLMYFPDFGFSYLKPRAFNMVAAI